MGISDTQFKAFVRFLLDALAELDNEDLTAEQKKEKLEKVRENLQKTLED